VRHGNPANSRGALIQFVVRDCKQAGRSLVYHPDALGYRKSVDYPYIKLIYYLNLHCNEETREKRLSERNWSDEMIQDHKDFAEKLLEIADKEYNPPMPTIDKTETDVSIVASNIKREFGDMFELKPTNILSTFFS
jgi:hypothetical protein